MHGLPGCLWEAAFLWAFGCSPSLRILCLNFSEILNSESPTHPSPCSPTGLVGPELGRGERLKGRDRGRRACFLGVSNAFQCCCDCVSSAGPGWRCFQRFPQKFTAPDPCCHPSPELRSRGAWCRFSRKCFVKQRTLSYRPRDLPPDGGWKCGGQGFRACGFWLGASELGICCLGFGVWESESESWSLRSGV